MTAVAHHLGAEAIGELVESEAWAHCAVLKRRITSSVISIASSA
jgi:hypothetical protein